jgi:hypothetical protein
VAPNERIQHRIQLIASRMRRRGAISEGEYRVALGLPSEAPAPAVDSTLFAPADLPVAPQQAPQASFPPVDSTASPFGEPTPEPAPVDTGGAPR